MLKNKDQVQMWVPREVRDQFKQIARDNQEQLHETATRAAQVLGKQKKDSRPNNKTK